MNNDALKKVGVITKFGKGCDIIVDHHIQIPQGFKAIKRLYKYLLDSKWKPLESTVFKIRIPGTMVGMMQFMCYLR